MKNDGTSNVELQKVSALIPDRQAVVVNNFSDIDSALDKKNHAKPGALNAIAKESAQDYFVSNTSLPRFSYVVHEKRDGIIASHALAEAFSEDESVGDVVVDPQINELNIASYIKPKALIKKGVASGFIAKKRVPISKTIISVIFGIFAALGVFKQFYDFLEILTPANAISELLSSFGIAEEIIIALFLVISIGVLFRIFAQKKANSEQSVFELNEKLNELDDDDFFEFVNEFDEDDFNFCECDSSKNNIFICVLSNYDVRQRNILKIFWQKTSVKSLWWIFTEYRKINDHFILDPSDSYTRRCFYMLPLSKSDKLKIAKETYKNRVSFTPSEDSGLKKYGVDFICRFIMKEKEPYNNQELEEKIKEFNKEHSSQTLHIRLVAQLASNYNIDFNNSHNWEYLFDYNPQNHALAGVDRVVSEKLLGADIATFKNLIPEIVMAFGDYFDDILALNPGSSHTSEYTQWCLIKALRCRGRVSETRCIAIADTLMNEFAKAKDFPEDLATDEWLRILLAATELFYNEKFYWFLASIIHNITNIFAKGNNNLKVFSDAIVLNVSKAALLLNFDSMDSLEPNGIDLIYDHFRVVTNACRETGKSIASSGTQYPSSFELLSLTKNDRATYYNALVALGEKDVISYYEYLFDIYVATLKSAKSEMKFCYPALYDNKLYEKYAKGKNVQDATSEYYISAALETLLSLYDRLYSATDADIKASITMLKDVLHNEGDITAKLLFLLAKFDISGLISFNFVVCMLLTTKTDHTISKDVYLNLGNYLIRLIFLTYHELNYSTFLNNDFIYFVKILTDYVEPGEATIGLLYYCNKYVKPMNSGKMIDDYIIIHRDMFFASTSSLCEKIHIDDIEEFAQFVTQSTEYKFADQFKKLLLLLRTHIEKNYAEHEKAPALLEYLTLNIENHPTKEFLEDTPENNIEKFRNHSDNLLYFWYTDYISLYRDKYLPLCPLVAERLFESTVVSHLEPIIYYAINSEDKTNESYVETLKKLFEYIDTADINAYEVTHIEHMLTFLSLINHNKDMAPELYSWADDKTVANLFNKLSSNLNEKYLLTAQEFVALRVYGNYGIVLYVKFTLTEQTRFLIKVPENYASLTADEKIAYIIDNHKKIKPFYTQDGKAFINRAYIDMLSAFINNTNDIQHRLNEKESLLRFAYDAFDIIDKTLLSNDQTKAVVVTMINDYIRFINMQ